jgi:hypothetical protein
LVSVSPASTSVAEGANTTLTLTRSVYTSGPLSVTFTLSSTSSTGAVYGTDYELLQGSSILSISGGVGTIAFTGTDTTASVIFRTLSDYASDPASVALTLSTGDSSYLVSGSGVSTIAITDTSLQVSAPLSQEA